MVVIKISQKHIERFIFFTVIIILLGMLANERIFQEPTECENESIEPEIPSVEPSNDSKEEDTSDESEENLFNDTEEVEVDEEIITENNSENNTTNESEEEDELPDSLFLSIKDIDKELVSDEKGELNSITIEIKNGLDKDLDPTIKYYLYDEESDDVVKNSPKRPFLEPGEIKANEIFEKEFILDRTFFRPELDKTIKLELIDEEAGIKKTILKRFRAE
ncbi:MAG: hypothetical protein ACQEP1_03265 [Nanobdellota archaeon]